MTLTELKAAKRKNDLVQNIACYRDLLLTLQIAIAENDTDKVDELTFSFNSKKSVRLVLEDYENQIAKREDLLKNL